MSEELKACPLCGGHAEIRNVGYEDQRPQCVMSKCRIGTVETFYSSEQATRYWNNLPRIDEQKKAEIGQPLGNPMRCSKVGGFLFARERRWKTKCRSMNKRING